MMYSMNIATLTQCKVYNQLNPFHLISKSAIHDFSKEKLPNP